MELISKNSHYLWSWCIAYSHLGLHFFDWDTSIRIFAEIHRVLATNGLLIKLNNSTSDPEYFIGKKLRMDTF